MLGDQQLKLKSEDTEEPLLLKPGDLVLLSKKQKRKIGVKKLKPKFIGSYKVLQSFNNNSQKLADWRTTLVNKMRLKTFIYSSHHLGPGETQEDKLESEYPLSKQ